MAVVARVNVVSAAILAVVIAHPPPETVSVMLTAVVNIITAVSSAIGSTAVTITPGATMAVAASRICGRMICLRSKRRHRGKCNKS